MRKRAFYTTRAINGNLLYFFLDDDLNETSDYKFLENYKLYGFNTDGQGYDLSVDIDPKLKSFELLKAHLGYNLEGSATVDLICLRELYYLRLNYIKAKTQLTSDDSDYFNLSNFKLIESFADLTKQDINLEDRLILPSDIPIDSDLREYFNDMMFYKRREGLVRTVKNIDVKFSLGGLHGSIKNKEINGNIIHIDVTSLYPSLLIKMDLLSRKMSREAKQKYKQIYNDRIKAKETNNKAVAEAYKMVLNTVTGAMDTKYSKLYDPSYALSLRASGQLYMYHLLKELESIKSLRFLNVNTDGVFIELANTDIKALNIILKDFTKLTDLKLTKKHYTKMIIKDVNNYLAVDDNDDINIVGSLRYGVYDNGLFKINNNNVAIKKAVIEYLVNGTDVMETLDSILNIKDFQIIEQHKEHIFKNGKNVSLGGIVRTYATIKGGELYAIDSEQRPILLNPNYNVTVDNEGHFLEFDLLDLKYYEAEAMKIINLWKGEKNKYEFIHEIK